MRKISFILLFMFLVLTGSSNTKTEAKDFAATFGMPEQIIVYNKGSQTKLDKGSEKYDKIIKILNEQFKKEKNLGLVESKVKNTENEKSVKQQETSLEFIYFELSRYPWDAKNENDKKAFIKILWALTGKNTDTFELGVNSGVSSYGNGAVGKVSKELSTKVLQIIQ